MNDKYTKEYRKLYIYLISSYGGGERVLCFNEYDDNGKENIHYNNNSVYIIDGKNAYSIPLSNIIFIYYQYDKNLTEEYYKKEYKLIYGEDLK